jgi:pimeloyl-ACP methyl ester carboxylesterase
MRNILAFVAIFQLLGLFAAGQNMDKVRKDFEDKLRDTTLQYGHNKSTGKFYDIRGFKMYAEIYGQGAPLLIIHGNGGSIRDFIYQIPYFEKKYRVIIADSRAQGNSADRGDSLTYEMMADDYSALLDAMKIDSAYVIGWSDGGINALLLAIRHPEKVKKLASTGANLVPDTTAVPKEVWDIALPTYFALKAKTPKTQQEKNDYKLMRLLAEQPHIPLTDLQKISCPSLIIGGDHDVIKEEHTMLIYKNIPKAYLWILPGSGHSTPVFFKDDFNKVVDRFFSTSFKVIAGEGRFF